MRFHKIYIEITDICHLSCSFCTPKKAQRGVMPLPLFERIIAQVAPYTKLVSLHVLGDPLCVEQLEGYIETAGQHGVRLDIVSSGIFLHEKHFALLAKKHIHQVSFSLDSLLHNRGVHLSVDSYIDRICALYRYAREHAPHLYINIRLFSPYNYESILPKFQHAQMQSHKRRVRLDTNFFLRFHKPFVWQTSMKHRVNHISEQSANTPKDSAQKPYCLGAIKQLGILANGIVVPCCIDANGRMPLGSFATQDFQSILHAEPMRHLQYAMRTHTNLPTMCQTCSFRGV